MRHLNSVVVYELTSKQIFTLHSFLRVPNADEHFVEFLEHTQLHSDEGLLELPCLLLH